MKGTEKQIRWAEKIRESFIKNNHYKDYLSIIRLIKKGKRVAAGAEIKPIIGFLEKEEIKNITACDFIKKIEETLQIENASWWIENRNKLERGLLPDMEA